MNPRKIILILLILIIYLVFFKSEKVSEKFKFKRMRFAVSNLKRKLETKSKIIIETANQKKLAEESKKTYEQITIFKKNRTSTSAMECNQCNNAMKIIEPTITALYKVFIEKDPGGVISSLATSLVQGIAVKNFEKEVLEKLNNNKELQSTLVNIGGDENKVLDYIEHGVNKGIRCLVEATGSSTKKLSSKGKKGMSPKKFGVQLMHSFVRCLMKEMTRKIVMEITKCNDEDACRPSISYFEELEKGFNKIVEDKVELTKITTEEESKSINKLRDECSIQ